MIRSNISPQITFRELLAQISNNYLNNLENQYFPFHQLGEINNIARLSLTRAMFSFVNLPGQNKKITTLNVTPLESEHNTADFDLTLSLKEKNQQIIGNLIYKTDLFQTQTINQFISNFKTLLETIVSQPEISINNLSKFISHHNCIIDYQGNKVNLEKVKNTFNQHSKIEDSYITVSNHQQQDKQLIAYIVSNQPDILSVTELKQYLSDKLPQYLIPTVFVFIESFPLTTDNKIDIEALLKIDIEAIRQQRYIAPNTDIETKLVEVWQDVFNVNKIGINDNFFSLGGNSLLATQVVTKIKNKLKMDIPLKIIFEKNTIKEISDYITNRSKNDRDKSCIITIKSQGVKAPLYFINSTKEAHNLNKYLDNEQPFYSFNIFSLTTRIKKPFEELTIADFAKYIIDDLLKYQSVESYNLVGFCQDGALTLEIAKQLMQRGKKVNLLGLIDVVLNHKGQKFTLLQRIQMLSKFKLAYLKPRIKRYLNQTKIKGNVKQRSENKDVSVNNRILEKVQLDKLLYQNYRRAIRSYQASIYDGKIVSFRTFEWKNKNYQELEKITTKKLEIINIESTHNLLFKEPFIKLFAEQLNSCFIKVKEN